uniref:Cytochrome P450 n=1 Tax=Rhizophora mucronata TaxID=61149 RepID=A0A2P2IYD8_RHIMU
MAVFICFILCLLFTFVCVIALQGSTRRSSRKLPLGPATWPIIGNILELGDKPHMSLAELSKIHGPLMSLKLGRVTTVVISSANMAKEVLRKHDLLFCDRTVKDSITACDHHKVGLPWLPVSEPWRNLRKICNSYLFTSRKLDANQDVRRKKVEELRAIVQESCRLGTAVDIGQAAFRTILGSLSNIVFSLDVTNSSAETVQEFKEVVRCIMDEAGKPNLSDCFPMLKKIDPQGIRHRMEIHVRKLLKIFDLIIQERLELRKMEGYIPFNDMLDALLTSEDNKEDMDINCIKHLFLVEVIFFRLFFSANLSRYFHNN